MRHGIAGNRFGRHKSWRKATVRDIAKAALVKERIRTTKAKAKEARKLVDRLITLGKKGTLAHRRRAYAVLCNHKLVSELFASIAPRFKMRQGGYTRLIPLADNRRGDNAEMVYLELTEKKPVPVVAKPKKAAMAKQPAAPTASVSDVAEGVIVEKQAKDDAAKSTKNKAILRSRAASKSGEKETKESGKAGKKAIGGGIKKIFRRKISSE